MELRPFKAVCGLVVLAAIGFFTLFPQLDWLDLGLADDFAVAASFDRIQTAMEAEDWDQAITELNAVLKIDPQDADSHFLRGLALYHAGQPDLAIADFDATLKAHPDDVEALVYRGCAYDDLDQPVKALADLDAAVRLAPDDAAPYAYRGKFHEDRGRYQAARADYQQAARLAPEDTIALSDLARLLAAAPEKSLRDPARSLQLARQAVELDGGHEWESLDALAAAYAANGKFPSAVHHATGALQLAPAEERAGVQQRLDLYQAKQAYRLGSEPIIASATSAE